MYSRARQFKPIKEQSQPIFETRVDNSNGVAVIEVRDTSECSPQMNPQLWTVPICMQTGNLTPLNPSIIGATEFQMEKELEFVNNTYLKENNNKEQTL